MAEVPSDPSTVATSAPEAGHSQIKYLLPAPPGFAPEYDYLALLKSLNLNDAAGPAMSYSFGQCPFWLPPNMLKPELLHDCRAHLINSSGSESWYFMNDRPFEGSKGQADWMYEQIQYTRQKLVGNRQEGTTVLVVDNIDWEFLQILGPAMDLDPTFLWRHYNYAFLDSNEYVAELARLRNDFFSLVAASKMGQAGTEEYQEPSSTSTDGDRSIHVYYSLNGYPKPGVKLWSAISCYRFSVNSCTSLLARHLVILQCGYLQDYPGLILTSKVALRDRNIAGALPQPFAYLSGLRCKNARHTTHLPLRADTYFEEKIPIRLQRPRGVPRGVPRSALSVLLEDSCDAFLTTLDLLRSKSSNFLKSQSVNERDLIFGEYAKSLTPENVSIVLQWLLTVSLWKTNIRVFESQLHKLSNLAMSKPSLKTFRPIPALRQNIIDMRDALQQVKDGIGSETIAAFSELQKTTNHQLESLDSVFETLLKKTDALSAKAGNEIQLVIGSVTIQVLSPHPCRIKPQH